jgi:outer membrane protein assembly factor BamB
MDFGFESFDSGFSDFDVDIEDFEVRKIGKHERMFKFGFGGSIAGEPVIHGDFIIFSAMDGYLYCVDKMTSEKAWMYKMGDSSHFGPIVEGEKAIAACYDGYVYCVDMKGELCWRFRTGDRIAGSCISDGKSVYVGSRDGYFYAINVDDGSLNWRFRTGDMLVSSATISGEKVFFGSFDGNFYCLDKRNGKELWRFKAGSEVTVRFTLPVFRNMIYFPSFDNYLYCVNVESGKEVWRFPTGKYGSTGSPSLYNGVIYHGGRDGVFYAIDAITGKEAWRAVLSDSENPISTKPLVACGKLYLGTDDKNVYCLDLKGNILWRFRTDSKIGSPVVYDNGIIYAGSFDCHMYALDSGTGSEIWRYATSVLTPSYSPPAQEAFRIEVKKDLGSEDTVDEKYSGKSQSGSLRSEYTFKSEYATKSDYKTKSDYDVSLVIFEDRNDLIDFMIVSGNGLMEVFPWTSASTALTQAFPTLTQR